MRIIIFLCFSLFVVLSSCSKEKKIDPVSDQQMEVLNFLPEGTEFLIFMDLNELRKTSFWENYFDNFLKRDKANNWLSELEEETGIGFNRGISQFYTSSTWNGSNSLAFRIDYNPEKAKKYFDFSKRFIKNREKNINFYQSSDSKLFYYFAGDSLLLVFNDKKVFDEIISENHKSLKKNKNFIEVIEKIGNKNHYWIATDEKTYAAAVIEKIIGIKNENPVKDLISSIKNLTLSAEFSEGVEIESNWGCTSSKNAFLLSSAIKSALAMNLLSDGDPVLEKALDKVEIERDENYISFHLDLNQNDISELRDYAIKKNLDKKL